MRNKIFQILNFKMLFSSLFLLTLATVCYGQNYENYAEKFKKQLPVSAEVLQQTDSPIFLSVVNVDNSEGLFQKINFTMQNISDKSIKAYALTGRGTITSIHTKKLFEPDKMTNEVYYVERENIKPNMVITLSIDYVEFEDGTSWGADVFKQSEIIKGYKNGKAGAIEKIRELINKRDSKTLRNLFRQESIETAVPAPDSKQTDNWQRGFKLGYKSVIRNMQEDKEQNLDSLSKQLNKIENPN